MTLTQSTNIHAAIAAHRAAWQAFQDAPADDHHRDTLVAADAETEALRVLMATIPTNQDDLHALRVHLDWWVVEEAQRRDIEPEPFMLHAAICLASSVDIAQRLIDKAASIRGRIPNANHEASKRVMRAEAHAYEDAARMMGVEPFAPEHAAA